MNYFDDLTPMNYFDRIPCSEIRPNLWISSEWSGPHANRVNSNNIKVVIVMKDEDLEKKVHGVEYHLILVRKTDDDILMRFYWTNKIIEESLAENKAVLVVSTFGNSRSVAPVIAYLMKTEKLTFEQAYYHCKYQRDYIKLDPQYHAQLALYEVIKCDSNMNNRWMKRHYMVEMFRAKNVPEFDYEISEFIEYARQNFKPINPKPDPESMFQCRRCKCPLFGIDDVIGFDEWVFSFEHERVTINTVLTEWIILDDQYVVPSEGVINCPNCQLQVGEFHWNQFTYKAFQYKVNFRGSQIFDMKVPLVFQFRKDRVFIPFNFI